MPWDNARCLHGGIERTTVGLHASGPTPASGTGGRATRCGASIMQTMTEHTAERPRRGTAVAVFATMAFVCVICVLPAVVWLVAEQATGGDGTPNCEREPVVLEWAERDGSWWRSDSFELDGASQVVQVDVVLRPDGGVLAVGNSVYVARAGQLLPDADDVTSSTPFDGTRVGSGVEAVNETVRLESGTWELLVSGGAAHAEVRWPC